MLEKEKKKFPSVILEIVPNRLILCSEICFYGAKKRRKSQVTKMKSLLFSGKIYVTLVIFIDFWWCFHRCGWFLLVFCRFYEWKKIFIRKKEPISPPRNRKNFIHKIFHQWEQQVRVLFQRMTLHTNHFYSLTHTIKVNFPSIKSSLRDDNANAKQRVCEKHHISLTHHFWPDECVFERVVADFFSEPNEFMNEMTSVRVNKVLGY